MTKHCFWAFVCVGMFTPAMADPPADLAGPLQTLRAVGPNGQGSAAANAAWKKAAAAGAPALPAVLNAMDGANDYAMNWLRPAADAIVERETAAGNKLPLTDLGKFLLDTSHHPRTRRFAFELIARADASTADALLAGMLNDPSLELRHDAVRALIAQADEALVRTNKAGAGLLLQQALGAARDVPQIEGIAEKLEALGQPVNLQRHFGFLTNWKVIGPFDNTERKGFDTVFPPEEKLDLAAEYEGKCRKVKWQDFQTAHKYGMVDMNQPCGKLKEVTGYATTEFFVAAARPVELRLGGKNSWKLWLNGKLLFEHDEYHANTEIDQYPMPAQLQAGRNVVLVKVCQNEEVEEWTNEWEFQLRITDALGTPIAAAKN